MASDDKFGVSGLSELLSGDVFFGSIPVFWGPLTLRSMKSVISPGFVILFSSIAFSPVNILTTDDMDGRSDGVS